MTAPRFRATVDPGLSPPAPPYPNLGPEPLPEGPLWIVVSAAAVVVVLLVLTSLGLLLVRRRRARRRNGSPARGSDPYGLLPDSADADDGARLIRAALGVRDALVSDHGDSWRAFTTEEIADSDIDGTLRQRLVEFFKLADLAKFGGRRFDDALASLTTQRGPIDWEAWASELRAEAAAGARSITTGK